MRDIGRNIRAARIHRQMIQDTLAEQLHVSRQTISNYETGRSRPDIDMLLSVAETLDTDVHPLLYGLRRRRKSSGTPRRWCGSQYTRYFFSGLYAAAWSFPLFFGAVWLAPFSGLRHRSGRQTASETLGEVLPLAGIGFFLALF